MCPRWANPKLLCRPRTVCLAPTAASPTKTAANSCRPGSTATWPGSGSWLLERLQAGPGGQRCLTHAAAFDVVVDHAHGLHESVQGGGAHESPAAFLQILGQGHGFWCDGQGLERFQGHALGTGVGGRLKAPEVGRQGSELF